MWYELWDSDTGNRVGKFPNEEAALRALLEDIDLYGRDAQVIVNVGLLQRDSDHRQDRVIAEGMSLVERALALANSDGANDLAGSAQPADQPSG